MTGGQPDEADTLPEPPPDLAQRTLPMVERTPGDRLLRIHRANDGAIWFGWDAASATFRAATNRFDSPGRSFGVLYLALTRDGAFAESIGRKPRSFRADKELAELRLSTLALARSLRLVDLHGGAAVGAMGATGVVGVGPQSLARRWAQALHDHPSQPDGIEYRCRNNSDELAVALFNRVGNDAVVPVDAGDLVGDRPWLLAMRSRHQIWNPRN